MWQFFAYLKTAYLIILTFNRAHIAQSAEHFHGKEEAVCSIHTVGTRISAHIPTSSFIKKRVEKN